MEIHGVFSLLLGLAVQARASERLRGGAVACEEVRLGKLGGALRAAGDYAIDALVTSFCAVAVQKRDGARWPPRRPGSSIKEKPPYAAAFRLPERWF
jgi:hypothetical protein